MNTDIPPDELNCIRAFGCLLLLAASIVGKNGTPICSVDAVLATVDEVLLKTGVT